MTRQKQYISQVEDKLKKDNFKVAGKILKSRLIVGTGKYKSFLRQQRRKASMLIGNVAVRRVNILDKKTNFGDYLSPK